MLGVCYSLVKQLREEPVVSTVPPGVRTVVAEMRPDPTQQPVPDSPDDGANARQPQDARQTPIT
jgi:hypothetical protein